MTFLGHRHENTFFLTSVNRNATLDISGNILRRQTMRKFIGLFVLLTILFPSLIYTGGQSGSTTTRMVTPRVANSDDPLLRQGLPAVRDRRTNLEFLTIQSGAGFTTMEEFLSSVFQKHYPNITVDAQPIESGVMDDIVNTRLAAGNPVPVLQGGSYADRIRWARAGVLVDVTDLWERYNLESLIPEGIAAEMRVDGRYIAMPYNSSVGSIFYYNRRLIQQAGVTLPPYETWDQFFAAGRQFVAATGKPFFVDGYAPAWFGFVKSGHLAASYHGIDGFYRIANGRATLADFQNLLSFYKQLITDFGNRDFLSMESIAGSSEAVARGDGAVAFAGTWGFPRFTGAGLELDRDWVMAPMPQRIAGEGHVMIANASGMIAFKGSGFEEEARALMLSTVLKEAQMVIAPNLGFSPVRSDIDIADVPQVGRYPITQRSIEWFATAAHVIDRNFNLLPPQVRSEMPTVFGSFLAGSLTLDRAAQELIAIQRENQAFYTIEWGM